MYLTKLHISYFHILQWFECSSDFYCNLFNATRLTFQKQSEFDSAVKQFSFHSFHIAFCPIREDYIHDWKSGGPFSPPFNFLHGNICNILQLCAKQMQVHLQISKHSHVKVHLEQHKSTISVQQEKLNSYQHKVDCPI